MHIRGFRHYLTLIDLMIFGTVYVIDKNDKHVLRATRGDLKLVCVFFPALTGSETHRPDGSYAPADC
jgi:L-ectoine synthase